MVVLISGGSGSGKSAIAEKIAVSLANGSVKSAEDINNVVFLDEKAIETTHAPDSLIYIATMIQGSDSENKKKISRHRKQRSHYGFATIEKPFDIRNSNDVYQTSGKVVLLECLSNLTANEMFLRREHGLPELSFEQAEINIRDGLREIIKSSKHTVVVSNELFSNALLFDFSTQQYLEIMGKLNRQFADISDVVIEVVYGIPVIHQKTGFTPKAEE